MPSGAGPGGGFVFSTVGRNRFDVAASTAGSARSADGLERVAVKATIAAAAIVTTATHVHARLLRRGCETVLCGFERRLLIWRFRSNFSMSRPQPERGHFLPASSRHVFNAALRPRPHPDRSRNAVDPALRLGCFPT